MPMKGTYSPSLDLTALNNLTWSAQVAREPSTFELPSWTISAEAEVLMDGLPLPLTLGVLSSLKFLRTISGWGILQ